jgi:ribosome biogenesis ATPase
VFLRARSSVPCVIFFDELDALVPRRDDSLSEASARVVNTLLTELDGLDSRAGIYVIAATNRPDIIDPAMLRPGRLGTLLFVDLPAAEERGEILRTLSSARKTPLAAELDVAAIGSSDMCHGFSGADLESLLRTAALEALKRTDVATSTNSDVFVEKADFEAALQKVKPSVTDGDKYRRLALRSEWKLK